MKKHKQLERWAKIALVGVCVLLAFRLVSEIMGSPIPADDPAQSSAPPLNSASAERKAPKKGGASAILDSELQLQGLEEYTPRPFPDVTRNPFDFGAPPVTPAQRAAQAASAHAAASAAAASARIPLRAIGYSERAGVGPEAYLADSDEVYVVHDGDVISQRYKILKITSSIVEVLDGISGEKSQLPIPQVQ